MKDKDQILSCQKHVHTKIDKVEEKVEEVKDELTDLKLQIIPRLDIYNDQLKEHIAASKANSERLRHVEDWVIKKEAVEQAQLDNQKKFVLNWKKISLISGLIISVLTLIAKYYKIF